MTARADGANHTDEQVPRTVTVRSGGGANPTDERLASFDRDGLLAEKLSAVWEIIRERVPELQRAFWERFSSAEHTRRTHDAELLERLAERDRPYTEGKYNRPVDRAWMERISERGRLAARAENPTYAIIGGLNGSYERVCDLIWERMSAEPDRALVLIKAIYRLAAFETELMLAAVTDEHREWADARFRDQADRFQAEIAGIVDEVAGVVESTERQVAEAAEESRAMKRAASSIRALSGAGSHAVLDAVESADTLAEAIRSLAAEAVAAAASAARTNEECGSVLRAADALAEEVKAADRVLESIRAISNQTNLLALNASIEASRTAADGRAFGVVAAEIKALAHRARQATDEVGENLNSIRTTWKAAALSNERVAAAVRELDTSSATVGRMLHDQAARAESMAKAFETGSIASQQVKAEAETVDEAAERVAGNMDRLTSAFATIRSELATLENNVATFLEAARSSEQRSG